MQHVSMCPNIAPQCVCVCMCVFSTLWRIVSPLVVGCQLSLQTEQMSFNRPSLLKKKKKINVDLENQNIFTNKNKMITLIHLMYIESFNKGLETRPKHVINSEI